MLDGSQLDQIVFPEDSLDVLRNSVLPDCNAIDLPALSKFPWGGYLVPTQLASVFAGYPPYAEAPNLLQWSSIFANYLAFDGQAHTHLIRHATACEEHVAHQGRFTPISFQSSAGFVEYYPQPEASTLMQPTVDWTISPDGNVTARVATQPARSFLNFACDVVASALEVLSNFISESERKARESWKRLCRKNILSSGVSKNGHLSFLVPSYRQVCVETAARDQVVHLEVITLAEEQGAPSVRAVGQILILGWKSWKKMKSRSLSLFSNCLAKVLRSGSTDAGLSFASVKAL